MKIDLKRLKLYPQESEEFHLQAAGRDELLSELGGRFIAPVKLDLLVTNTGRAFAGQGKVRTVLELICSRCLEKVIFPVEADISLTLLESNNDEIVDNGDSEDIIYFRQSEADLQLGIEEAIFMSLPINPLCKDNCKGLCPSCGVNRNVEECHCSRQEIDPRWEKLKNLR
ncbi:MAG: DUF177 domain-containing protein [Syntrophomonas sp.]